MAKSLFQKFRELYRKNKDSYVIADQLNTSRSNVDLMKRVIHAGDELFSGTESDLPDELKIEVQEQKLRHSISYWKNRYKKLQKRLIENLDVAEAIQNYETDYQGSEFKYIGPKETLSKDLEWVILLSDTHYAEIVSYEGTFGAGVSSPQIIEEKLFTYANHIIDKFKKANIKPSIIHIALLGDMVSGDIHTELAITNDPQAMNRASLDLAQVLAEFLRILAENLPVEFRVHAVVGNHGRVDKKNGYKVATIEKNYDWLCYKILEIAAKQTNKRIKFNIPSRIFAGAEVAGYNFVFFHGFNIASYNGIPWYGIQRFQKELNDFFLTEGIAAHYYGLGHFHVPVEIGTNNGAIYVNGAMTDSNEYAVGRYGSARKGVQLILEVEKDKGVKRMEKVIFEPKKSTTILTENKSIEDLEI